MRQPADLRNQQRLGATVRRLRHDRDLTLEDLAHATGLDVTAISKLERGLVEPRLHTIIRVARGLTVKPADLMRGLK